MTTTLMSHVKGQWVRGDGSERSMHDATTGEVIATLRNGGFDPGAAVQYARQVGGPNLRKMTFHERALMLKGIATYLNENKAELYELSYMAGCTKSDAMIDVDGGIGTFFVYGSKGRRELPNAKHLVDGAVEGFAKDGSFLGLHLCTPLRGVAVHINAFNFPVWGMMEKMAPALLAGVPVITKPATPTADLAERAVRVIMQSGLLPEGAVQLVVGSIGDLFDHLSGQDAVGFTGSAATAAKLRSHACVVERSTRFTAEADSLNASVLAPSAAPGTAELDLFVREVAKEMCVKAGQKCTAIRRALVPRSHVEAVVEGLRARLGQMAMGNPRHEKVRLGPLASSDQRLELEKAVEALSAGSEVAIGERPQLLDAAWEKGAFAAPLVLISNDPRASAAHQVEPFGPVATLIPYDDLGQAVDFVALGGGSLVTSVFSKSADEARELALEVAPHNGRVLVIDERCGKTSTGHGSPLPHLVHGGPGRAGGGEELGGMRGVMHYLQRTALQGSPDFLTAITGTYMKGAERKTGEHPFRKHFEDLQVGDSVITESRTVTLDDIERFADLSGDRFYAHMDEEAAKASPIFEGRVAHGYFVVSMAAGLFVQPDPGPVLANYGLDGCRFSTPTYPGDELHVAFTCKSKSLRIGQGYGEEAWDTEVIRADGTVVAAYDVLTMVATRDGPAPE
ncbi:MAG: phenylacetic acid degradation bifunctional protein PaaZ [Myxococcota bacterium]